MTEKNLWPNTYQCQLSPSVEPRLPPLSVCKDEPQPLQWGGVRKGQVESWDSHPVR